MRLAIGAGSRRLVRQMLTGSAVLSTAGAIAGLLLAALQWWRFSCLGLYDPDL